MKLSCYLVVCLAGALALAACSLLSSAGAAKDKACTVIKAADDVCTVIAVPQVDGGTEYMKVSREDLIAAGRMAQARDAGHD